MATATASATAEARASGISRREFLYYIWGASMALFTAEFTGLLIWFAIPKFREGEFGGVFPLSIDDVPEVNSDPAGFAEGRFWLVNVDNTVGGLAAGQDRMYQIGNEGTIKGIAAVYKVCTHLGCIYAWNEANRRFECPCHGSKYRLDGRRIEAPAPRNLDRFRLTALDAQGNVLAQSEPDGNNGIYRPLELPDGTAALQIDTGDRARGISEELICDILNNCP